MSELLLKLCSGLSSREGQSDFVHTESCEPGGVNVRLVNGTSERSGRVKLCWRNQWKAVCDDGWGIEEAITVCRELGYLNSNSE